MNKNEESTKNIEECAIRRYSPIKFATVGPGHKTTLLPKGVSACICFTG